MDAPVAARRGETETHVRLKRLSLIWAQANGYSVCAAEVNLPQCRYRADVAAYRPQRGQPGMTAIFECKQALADLRRDNCHGDATHERLRSVSRRLRCSKNISGSTTPPCAPAIPSFPNTIRRISRLSGTVVTAACCGSSPPCRTA
jgi:hypothetical protein